MSDPVPAINVPVGTMLNTPFAVDHSPLSSNAACYFELTKPKIAMMALVTVAVGFLLGGAPNPNLEALVHTLIGTALVAAGGSALNHWLERRADAKMNRTKTRPLPAGHLSPQQVLAFGLTLAFAGVIYLSLAVPYWQATVAAAATAILYVLVYTPLKQVTAWNTVIGAVPGALPPVIGWCAARGDVTLETLALFLILFTWQLPHFYSIAWLHRHDYARGGFRMLPNVDRENGLGTGIATALTCVLLIGVAVMPYAIHAAGATFLIGSLLLGGMFLDRSIRFAKKRNDKTARAVLRGSLLYLLGVMALLVIDSMVPKYLS